MMLIRLIFFLALLSFVVWWGFSWFTRPQPVFRRREPREAKKGEIQLVPFYDYDTRSLTMIPENELDTDNIKVMIEDLGVEAYVDSDQYESQS